MYNILQVRIEYKSNEVECITVLVEMSKGDVRAILASKKIRPGYMHLKENAIINNDLIQEVAGYGMETSDRDKLFPGWKKSHN